MRIIIGSDHRGFKLKQTLLDWLKERGILVEDAGSNSNDPGDDYPDVAFAVAKKVAGSGGDARGVLLCGSGAGVDMVANKVKGIRSALVFNEKVARQSREHEDANVISLPADWVDEKEAKKIVDAWMSAVFTGENRHKRRLAKMEEVEGQSKIQN
jgi:ribose 5-phosphate isomerase B